LTASRQNLPVGMTETGKFTAFSAAHYVARHLHGLR
jgi:hypothetical protein